MTDKFHAEVVDISLQGAGLQTKKWLSELPAAVLQFVLQTGLAPEDLVGQFVIAIPSGDGEVFLRLAASNKARETLTDFAKSLRGKGARAEITDSIIKKCELGSTSHSVRIVYFDADGFGSAQILIGIPGLPPDQGYGEVLRKFREVWEDVVARAKRVVVPPNSSSANNIEATLMAAAYTFEGLGHLVELPEEAIFNLVGIYSRGQKTITALLERMDSGLRGKPYSGKLQDFGDEWLRAGFPKLEVGHKLAATLAMTDVPDDIDVVAPWNAWSLVVPPGLFGPESEGSNFARLLVRGSTIEFIIDVDGKIFGAFGDKGPFKAYIGAMAKAGEQEAVNVATAIESLVKGACLALSNPDDYKKNKVKDSSSSKSKSQRDGQPDFSVDRFLLTAPVTIDVRPLLVDFVSGKKRAGGSPSIQFFVRGHWRNQAHGPGLTLRKTIRIEGFWKGPAHGAVKLGNYKVRSEE